MKVSAASHRGRIRDKNEDALLVDESSNLIVVADGMGGHPAGEVASDLTVRTIGHVFTTSAVLDAESRLVEAVVAANAAVRAHGARVKEHQGLASTVVAATIEDDALIVAYAGDSRAYVLMVENRESECVQQLFKLTQDHEESGQLTNGVGVGDQIRVSVRIFPWLAGCKVMLCSDGLYRELTPKEIADGLAQAEPANRLVEAAVYAGGRDNVSVIVVEG